MKKIVVLLLAVLPLLAVAQDAAKLQKRVAAGDANAMVELTRCYEAGHGVPVDTARAVELARQAMAAGNADAKALMAYYHLWYSGLERDSALIFRLAKESADAGSDYGAVRLAYCYQDGIGVPRNYTRAKAILEEAAAKGSLRAIAALAMDCLYGDDSIDYDPARAFALMKRMEENCNSSKFTLMATYYSAVKNDYKTAWKWIRKGQAMDNQRSCIDAVYYTFYGYGCKEDEQAAFAELERLKGKYGKDNYMMLMTEYQLRLAARDTTLRDTARLRQLLLTVGDEPLYSNYNLLAGSYIYGTFTPVDSAAAERYWIRGDAKDDEKSTVQLAILRLNQGYPDQALALARKAYDRQDDESANFLARCYLYGRIGGEQNLDLAKSYYLESARRGNPEDLVEAGKICLWQGDTVNAFRHFDRAIALGYTDAYVNKAYTYLESGVRKPGMALLEKGAKAGSRACLVSLGDEYSEMEDYRKAASYFERAATPEGDYKLGRLWLYGAIGEQSPADMKRGADLLKKAAGGGNIDASMLLARAYMEGAGVPERPDSARIIYRQLANEGNGEAMLRLASYYDGLGDTASALDALREGAARDNVVAMLTLGEKLIEGQYLPADTAAGLALYQRAAAIEPEHFGVQVAMAQIYLEGIGTAPDTAAAIPYLRRAAAQESGWALSQLGDLHAYGRAGLPKDSDSAMFYYYSASQQDDPRGDYMMGVYREAQGKYEAALTYYASAARNGNRDAYVEVARALQNGNGIEANPEQAFQMAQTAATEWDMAEGYMLLGYAYINGAGCERDSVLGEKYTRMAAERGSSQAMMNLAAMYNAGYCVEKDSLQTLYWYQRAVEAGSVTAMRRLANSYYEGSGVPQDRKRAAELYQMAVDRGNTDAMCRLGLMYEEGEGVVLNSRKAFNLYNQAADRGSAWGMRLVAYCYAQGIYVKEDMEQAAKWFLQSAEAGDVQSCYIIGMFYSDGTGVKKNKKEAKRWLTLAAENGHPQAAEALQSL